MGKAAIIVESPAKTKTLRSFVGGRYKLLASMGHVRDLPEHDLGVDIADDFQPTYQVIPSKRKVLAGLKKQLEDASEVYLATDPDREGEAIAWHLAEALELKSPRRIQFNEITRQAVLAALDDPGEIDLHRVDAQQARRVLDRLVGYEVSPLLQRRLRKRTLSAGRVQSVALRLICDREREIAAFVPEESWTVEARLTPTDRDEPFLAKVVTRDGEEITLAKEDDARGVVADLEGAAYVVTGVARRERRRKPWPPFITSTLQQQGARKLGFSARKTMAIAQQLYEGVDLEEEGSVGLITYMRTDSTRVAELAQAEARRFITATFGKDFVGEAGPPPAARPSEAGDGAKRRRVQDAHEAIRPTDVSLRPDDVKAYLDPDQLALYTLIWRRFVASQMAPAVYDVTTVDIAAGRYGLRATGSIVKFPGFLEVYEEEREEDRQEEDEEGRRIPELTADEVLRLLELLPQQHFTKPPPRYSEASLVKELEQNGIGRPSTYAQIIDVLRQRDYVRMQRRRFVPTRLGFVVCDYLVENFTELMEVEFTAQMEEGLDTVERGDLNWADLVRKYYNRLAAHVTAAREARDKKLGEQCPECGGALVEKLSVHGRFAGCENYPRCEYTRPIEEPALALQAPEELAEECPECGKPLLVREGRRGRFVGCSGYPECSFTRPLSDDGGPRQPPQETDIVCELCGGKMLLREGRRGKFLGCSNYPKCRNTKDVEDVASGGDVAAQAASPEAGQAPEGAAANASEPSGETCEQCGKPMVVRRGRRGRFLGCSGYPRCRNTRPLRGQAGEPKARAAAVATDRTCPDCGKPLLIRRGSRGSFLGCSGYPKCRHIENLPAGLADGESVPSSD